MTVFGGKTGKQRRKQMLAAAAKTRSRLVAAYNTASGVTEAFDRFKEKNDGFDYQLKEEGENIVISADMRDVMQERLLVVAKPGGRLSAYYYSTIVCSGGTWIVESGRKEAVGKVMAYVSRRFGGQGNSVTL